jgi:hypothetical protein
MAGRAMPPDEALWLSAYAKLLVPSRFTTVFSASSAVAGDAFHFRS